MPDPDDYEPWVAAHPPPDLQQLITAYGSYSAIPADAWQRHDLALRRWQLERIDRLLKRTNKQPPNFAKKF